MFYKLYFLEKEVRFGVLSLVQGWTTGLKGVVSYLKAATRGVLKYEAPSAMISYFWKPQELFLTT